MSLKVRNNKIRERNRPTAFVCLRLDKGQVPVNTLKGSLDVQDSAAEIDIGPLEPEGFSLSQTNGGSGCVQRLQAVP